MFLVNICLRKKILQYEIVRNLNMNNDSSLKITFTHVNNVRIIVKWIENIEFILKYLETKKQNNIEADVHCSHK